MAQTDIKERFYKGADFTTLQLLEDRCNKNEANLHSELIKLELAEKNGDEGTLGTYKKKTGSDLGNLKFEEYTTTAQANQILTSHSIPSHQIVLVSLNPPVQVQIGANVKKILVHRVPRT